MACTETIYEVWKSRNEKIFSQKDVDHNLKEKIIDNIVGRCIKNRNVRAHIDVSTNILV